MAARLGVDWGGGDAAVAAAFLAGAAGVVGALGVAAACAPWRRRRPTSYPGDARPLEQQLKRQARFRSGLQRAVEPGWQPVVEHQPEEDLLPHKVAGQQIWAFTSAAPTEEAILEFDAKTNPNSADCIFRAARLRSWTGPRLQASAQRPSSVQEAVQKGFAFYQMLQCDDGHWAGDYGGPHFLVPGFVIAAYVTGNMNNVLSPPHQRAIEAYLRNHQQEDGGWGTHIESPSTMFGSSISYVALRLLGAPSDDPACVKAREFLHMHGGALYAPSWAKFWLCILGVYDWEGFAPVPPELWLLPKWFPVHPGRFWCHCRMVYLPMCYLYARRYAFDAARDPTASALRSELYPSGTVYADIKWRQHLHSVADIDNYSPIHWFMRRFQEVMALYERWGPWKWLRQKALQFVQEFMHSEDVETNYLTIGPVSKALHLLCAWVHAGGEADAAAAEKDPAFRAHVARVPAYLWVAEDGMKVQGYNGSMVWDTSFAMQAAVDAEVLGEFPQMCGKAFSWLAREQVRALPYGDWQHWRQPIRGGWGFSTAEQAWPVADTTAEAFKAVLLLRGHACTQSHHNMPEEHLFDTVQFLLSYQNADGGWATYENCRGPAWYELLNPAEVFGDIMIDYSYIECSASAMSALALFTRQFPNHRSSEVARAIKRGARFIKAMQRDDGSWYGCWGSCFTYGCWFGVEGLIASGEEPKRCPEIQRCVQFLLKYQNADGGWGEDFTSCYNLQYSAREKLYGCDSGSSVVQTSWALLALIAGQCEDEAAVRRGVDLLMRRQLPNGDWPQENIAGVFNRSVGITYTAFRNVFPLWALGRFRRQYSS